MDSRINRKTKKKKRGRKIILLLLIIILAVVGYSAVQFYSGYKAAGGDQIDENYEFNGVKDENGRINILLLGVDSRGEEKSRTDSMMIAQVDPKTNETKIVSLMRDMYVQIPGYQGYKLNTAFYLGGPELLRQTIKENFGIDVQYYMIADFKGFEKSVDILAPDGIEMNVEHAMSKNIGVSLEPGVQKLNGKELLGYARFRYDAKSDFGRVERQQEVISALKDEVLSIGGVTKLPKLAGSVQPYIQTNMSKMDQISIVKDVVMGSDKEIDKLTLPLEGTYTFADYSGVGNVMEVNFETNSKALQDFLNGKSSDEVKEQ
ncbi:LCP family protein [Rossellomorea marisflavi]|uniref:LCP family protein n=1 Tax=Rossellomorea marisflavi TaxID=189381 RepID=UPI00064FA23E|nr:LCP family protein [Rossellomorea marisflavi]KMK97363.1 transcriptional regulator [Rossellomorea marisflavi]KML06939.1 transcriptional regulator [Rossellomorea marisflavi]KML35275.1 transcriptional regulator [Rossellomorea marisflavi]QHA36524.1 LytR family transcriptional regulator [Rossellomorea marisflavi]TYO72707.1 LytR family transcriptional regulator [Rossellomorea marisflavi]